jgi:hypothetical protein
MSGFNISLLLVSLFYSARFHFLKKIDMADVPLAILIGIVQHQQRNHELFTYSGKAEENVLESVETVNRETVAGNWPEDQKLQLAKGALPKIASERRLLHVAEATRNLEGWSVALCVAFCDNVEMEKLLTRYGHLFYGNNPSFLKSTTVAEHHVNTEDYQPIRSAPYRVNHTEREAIRSQVEEMLQAGIIEPSTSPWSSPVAVVLVPNLKKKMSSLIYLFESLPAVRKNKMWRRFPACTFQST